MCSEEFREHYRWRAGIEATMSRFKHQMGMARLRVRGMAKVTYTAMLRAWGSTFIAWQPMGGNQVSWKSCRGFHRGNANTKLKETSDSLLPTGFPEQPSEKREQKLREGQFIEPFCRRVECCG